MHELLCPTCSIPLQEKIYSLHAVEVCPNCGGMLIDSTELEEHITQITANQKIIPAAEVISSRVIKPFLLNSQNICPRDATRLRYINYGYESNVLLEQCASCKVLWVSADRIIPLAAYLKRKPELVKLGERLERDARHQNLNETVISDSRVTLTTFPIPLGDTTHTLSFPWIVILLIVIETVLFFMSTLAGIKTETLLSVVALIPADILHLQNLHTLFTYQVFHLNILHLMGNLFTLRIFGDNVESRMNPLLFLTFFVGAGIWAALVASALAVDPHLPMIGASGAISAVLGSYLVLYPHEKVRVLFLNSIIGITVWKYLFIWIGFQILNASMEQASREVSPVSFTAHIAGFVFGIIVTLLLKKYRILVQELNIFQNQILK